MIICASGRPSKETLLPDRRPIVADSAACEAAMRHCQAEAGTETAPDGTSVATETCGQMRPLKFNRTICEY